MRQVHGIPLPRRVRHCLEADDSVRLQQPHFCARCSRLALSLGVAEWIFALSEGWPATPQLIMTGWPSSGGNSPPGHGLPLATYA
jgi:hypothetical protein